MNEPTSEKVSGHSDAASGQTDAAPEPSETTALAACAPLDADACCATTSEASACGVAGLSGADTALTEIPARRAVVPAAAPVPVAVRTSHTAAIDITSVAHFESLIIHGGRAALVDFWSGSCGPCGCMAPHFEAIAEEVGEALIFAKVNTGDVPELARAFNIRSVPTVVALNGSKVVDVHVGGAQPATLRNLAVRTMKKAGQPVPAHLKPAGFIRGLFGG